MNLLNRLARIAIAGTACFISIVHGAEKDDAEQAAVAILNALDNRQYETVWNSLTSKWFKEKTTKDSFLANMTMGRAQLGGKATEKQLVDYSYATQDPGTGFKGKIYAFNFKTAYPAGQFYERIVVVQEMDGKFRLSGLWGQPR